MAEWTKSFENEAKHEDQMILRHILQWPPFAQFVKINCKSKLGRDFG